MDGTIIDDIRATRLKMHTDKFEQSDKYKSVERVSAELYNLLRSTLTPEQQDQLDLMDEEFWKLLALYEEHYYLCGLKDGIEMRQILFPNN